MRATEETPTEPNPNSRTSLYIVYLFIAKFALTYFSMVRSPCPAHLKVSAAYE